MAKRLILILVILHFGNVLHISAQSNIKPLKIGDRVPEIEFRNMFNYTNDNARLSDFKGKLLIIDVWNKWCSSCIDAFPKMEALQKIFGSKIQIILLTEDSTEDFLALKRKSHILNLITLPFVTGDTMINKLFPHRGVPLHIWIDSAGIVRAMTSGYNTTKNNLSAFFNNDAIKINNRDNESDNFDSKKPLLTEGNGRHIERLQTYSLFMKSLKNYRFTTFGFYIDSVTKKRAGIRFVNYPLSEMLTFAYEAPNVILEFEDAQRYLYPRFNDDSVNNFVENYEFCYEQYLPEKYHNSNQAMRRFMQEDLVRYFDINVTKEIRTLKCLNLITIGRSLEFTKVDSSIAPISENLFSYWIIKNKSINFLTDALSQIMNFAGPIINKTGYSGDINVEFNVTDNGINSINNVLQKFNLKLIPGEVKREVLIVKRN